MAKVLLCSCSRPCTKSTDSSDSVLPSPHPIGFRDDLIDAFERLPKLVEHVHLPLPIGFEQGPESDAPGLYRGENMSIFVRASVGRAMALLLQLTLSRISRQTEIRYKQTRDLVEENPIRQWRSSFRYSPRRDNPAAEMPDQIDERVKKNATRICSGS